MVACATFDEGWRVWNHWMLGFLLDSKCNRIFQWHQQRVDAKPKRIPAFESCCLQHVFLLRFHCITCIHTDNIVIVWLKQSKLQSKFRLACSNPSYHNIWRILNIWSIYDICSCFFMIAWLICYIVLHSFTATHRIHGAGIYANIGGILMGSMLPYIAAPLGSYG